MVHIPDPVKFDNVRPSGMLRPEAVLQQPQLVEVSLMFCRSTGRYGVSCRGGRFVCQLPPGYNRNCGILPHDGKLIVTLPGLPTLVVDPMTGRVRRQ